MTLQINTQTYPFLAPFNGCADPHTFRTIFEQQPLDDEQLECFAAWMLNHELWDPFLWLLESVGGMSKLVPRAPGLFDQSLSMKPSAASTLLIRHGFLRAAYWLQPKVRSWRKHPLRAVIRKGDAELLQALLAHNSYFQSVLRMSAEDTGRTLLFECENPKITKKLLEARVPLDTKDQAKVLALDHHLQKLREQAVGNPALEQVVGILMGAHIHRSERLQQAAAVALEFPGTLDVLLEHGLSANQRLDDGMPMLSAAVSRGDEVAVLALLDAGADPSLCDNSGNSALDYAAGRPLIAHQIHQKMARALAPSAISAPSLTLGKTQSQPE